LALPRERLAAAVGVHFHHGRVRPARLDARGELPGMSLGRFCASAEAFD
jgi:hypothetical protein